MTFCFMKKAGKDPQYETQIIKQFCSQIFETMLSPFVYQKLEISNHSSVSSKSISFVLCSSYYM